MNKEKVFKTYFEVGGDVDVRGHIKDTPGFMTIEEDGNLMPLKSVRTWGRSNYTFSYLIRGVEELALAFKLEEVFFQIDDTTWRLIRNKSLTPVLDAVIINRKFPN